MIRFLIFLSILIAPIPAWFVSHSGENTPDCGNLTIPCATLEYTYQLSSDGDTIYLESSSQPYAPLDSTIEHSLTIAGYGGKAHIRCVNLKYGCTFFLESFDYLVLENLTLQGCSVPAVTAVCMIGDPVLKRLVLRNFDYLNNRESGGLLVYAPGERITRSTEVLLSQVRVINNTVYFDETGAYSSLIEITILENPLNTTGDILWERVELSNNTGAVSVELQRARAQFTVMGGIFNGVEDFSASLEHQWGGAIIMRPEQWESMDSVSLSCYCLRKEHEVPK